MALGVAARHIMAHFTEEASCCVSDVIVKSPYGQLKACSMVKHFP